MSVKYLSNLMVYSQLQKLDEHYFTYLKYLYTVSHKEKTQSGLQSIFTYQTMNYNVLTFRLHVFLLLLRGSEIFHRKSQDEKNSRLQISLFAVIFLILIFIFMKTVKKQEVPKDHG